MITKRSFKKFMFLYGTPVAILIGAVFIAVALFVSFGLPKFSNYLANRSQNSPVTAAQPAPAKGSSKSAIVAVDTTGLPMLGSPSAPVVLVEFADFQCPYCAHFFQQTFAALKKNYIDQGKIKFYVSDLAFLGQESVSAAQAAKCAGEQNKFWEYYSYLYTHQGGENQGAFSDKNLKSFAVSLGLNAAKFSTCLVSKKYEQAVQEETSRGHGYGITGTPTFVLNGQVIEGALPYETFKLAIDKELTQK